MSRVLLSTVLPLLSLAACSFQEASQEHSFAGPITHVVLDAGGADVRVTAHGESAGARVVETTSWRGEPPEVQVELVDGELRIAVDCGIRLSVGTACSVDFDVEVPATATVTGALGSGDLALVGLVGPVELETGSGDVDLRDLVGDIWLDAGSGDVTGRGLAAARVELFVGSGNIDLVEDIAPEAIWLESGSGDIHLTVPAGAYDVQAITSTGDVSVAGIERNTSSSRTIVLEAGSGDLTLVGR